MKPIIVLTLCLCLTLVACGGRAVQQWNDGASSPTDGAARSPIDAGTDSSRDGAPRFDATQVQASEGLIYLSEVFDAHSTAQQGSAFAFFTPRPMPFFSPLKQLGGGCALYPGEESPSTDGC